MDGLAHMQAFIHLINEIMAPILKLGDASFEERPAPHIISRQLGPNDQPVAVSIEGWGIAFEKVSMRWKTGMDISLDPETAAIRAAGVLHGQIERQRGIAARAAAVGITSPLEGDDLLSTAHLLVDPDAITTLIAFTGTHEAAAMWLHKQMIHHRADIGPFGQISAWANDRTENENACIIRVMGEVLHVPFALSPLRPARGAGKIGGPIWEDEVIYLDGLLPESVTGALEGRSVSDLLSTSPIGHRIIRSATSSDFLDFALSQVTIDIDRRRVNDLLPMEKP